MPVRRLRSEADEIRLDRHVLARLQRLHHAVGGGCHTGAVTVQRTGIDGQTERVRGHLVVHGSRQADHATHEECLPPS